MTRLGRNLRFSFVGAIAIGLLLLPAGIGCGGGSGLNLTSISRIYVLQTGGKDLSGTAYPGSLQAYEVTPMGTLVQVGQPAATPLYNQQDLVYDEGSDSIFVSSTNPGVVGITMRQLVQYQLVSGQLIQVGIVNLDQGQSTTCVDTAGGHVFVGCSMPAVGGTPDDVFSLPVANPISGNPTQTGNPGLHSASAALANRLFVGNASGTVVEYTASGGNLTPANTFQVGEPVADVQVSATNEHLIVATEVPQGGNAKVMVYPIGGGAATTTITTASHVGPAITTGLVGSPVVHCLYVGDQSTGDVQAYKLESDGTVSAIGNPFGATNPLRSISVVQGSYLAFSDTLNLFLAPLVTTGNQRGSVDPSATLQNVNTGTASIRKFITVSTPK
ncbi:MAG: hypothetical protein HONBIEJF_01168 [Fimbriimonadaceae bacterium]|nr:hypothetical protein [Fimbriimonadaceae bacterium]